MSAYDQRRRQHVAEMTAKLPGHLRRLDWSAERLRLHRQVALRRLVGSAVERSRWHRSRLGGTAVDQPDERTLSTLPVMTKDDPRLHRPPGSLRL